VGGSSVGAGVGVDVGGAFVGAGVGVDVGADVRGTSVDGRAGFGRQPELSTRTSMRII